MFLCAQDDILSFEEEKQALYLQVYRPVYFQLVDVLLHKCHYPSQQEYESWSPEDKEQFRIYRWGRLPGQKETINTLTSRVSSPVCFFQSGHFGHADVRVRDVGGGAAQQPL